ncbi:MAG: hypothetical protein K1X52_09965 [Pyrinomonadaceae bacterium]|nr:hypothetical protein [Pyrinomonadaceae bacterium]
MSDILGLDEPRPTTGSSGAENAVPTGPDPALEAHAKRGANWFYWIAGLSAVNSGAFLMGAGFHFLAGLGITEVFDGLSEAFIENGLPNSVRFIAVFGDLLVVIGFALAGYWANKLVAPVFLIGIVLYFLDGLLVLAFGDIVMALFHAFALYQLIRGFLAVRELKKFYQASVPVAVPPPPPAFG